jgi:arylsulfatase A-like enzyme
LGGYGCHLIRVDRLPSLPRCIGCFDNAAPFPSDEPTIAHLLTNAGYETVLSGKMHFVGPDQLHGFRHRLTTDIFPAGLDWVPTVDERGRFPCGGHAHSYVPPEVGVRPWTKFFTYDEETTFRAEECQVWSSPVFLAVASSSARTLARISRWSSPSAICTP